MRTLLVAEEIIAEAKSELESLFTSPRAKSELHPKAASRVFATSPLDHHVPAFFEVHQIERGQPCNEAVGSTEHAYDAGGELVATTQRLNDVRERRWSTFRLDDDRRQYHRLDLVTRGRSRCVRLGCRWQPSRDVWCDVSVDGHGRATAHCWQVVDGAVRRVDVWDAAWAVPDSFDIERGSDGDLSATRHGDESTPTGGPRSVAQLAGLVTERVEAAIAAEPEQVAALTVCLEETSIAHLPPQIGVVYQRNLDAYRSNPRAFDGDLGFVWNPLQVEDAELPVPARYPFVEFRSPSAADLGLSDATGRREADAVIEFCRELVRSLNAAAEHQDWFFVLIEIESYDWMRHADLLPISARRYLDGMDPAT